MRALVVDRFGLANLRVGDVAEPVARGALLDDGDALVQVRAVSLNRRDLLVVQGEYDPRFPLPLVPCSDALGTVLAVGRALDPALIGARVMPAMTTAWLAGPPTRAVIRTTLGGPLPGTASERIVVPGACLVAAPAHLGDVEAAALPCAATTAYRALLELSQCDPSRAASHFREAWVLCQGTGGVSLFALQIAKALGARVALISKSDQKLALARSLGADVTLNYESEPDWGRRIRELTGGVSHVIEVGGPGTLERSLKACLPGATVSVVGALAGRSAPLDLLPAVMNQIRVQGVYVGPRESLERTAAFFERHRLVPHVHHTFSLADGVSAFEHLAGEVHVGKLCITI